MPETLPHTLTCARCAFSVQGQTPENGPGLASETFTNVVMAHYGSRFDGDVFSIAHPALVPKGMLCDGCVDVLLQAGVLTVETL